MDLCANTAQPPLKPTAAPRKEADENLTHVLSPDQDKIGDRSQRNAAKRLKLSQPAAVVSRAPVSMVSYQSRQPRCAFQRNLHNSTTLCSVSAWGLSIAAHLARPGGDSNVERAYKGSTFTLIIPIQGAAKARIITEPGGETGSGASSGTLALFRKNAS